MAQVVIRSLNKKFDEVHAVKDVNLDIRDKDDLMARRRARMRDLILWRVFIGCLIVMACALVTEGLLLGGKTWQTRRLALVARGLIPASGGRDRTISPYVMMPSSTRQAR